MSDLPKCFGTSSGNHNSPFQGPICPSPPELAYELAFPEYAMITSPEYYTGERYRVYESPKYETTEVQGYKRASPGYQPTSPKRFKANSPGYEMIKPLERLTISEEMKGLEECQQTTSQSSNWFSSSESYLENRNKHVAECKLNFTC